MHHCTPSNHGYANLPLKRYFDPFRRFCAAHPCAQHTQITLYSPNLDTGVNPGEDAGDTSLNILFGGDVNGNIPPILLRTFGYSRPILVALRSLSLKPISFGYKTPPIRFSQAGGQGSSPQP